MERAVIIGTLEFLGFYFCERILEEGIEVEGIHLDLEENKVLIEEKRLQIGRNANYNEWSSMEIRTLNVKGTVLFIDVYDLLMWEKESILFEKGSIKNLIDKYTEGEIIFLLPMSLKSNQKYKDIHAKLHALSAVLKRKGNSVQSYYLPSTNGTWLTEGIDSRDSFNMEEVVDAILEMILKWEGQ